MRLSAIAVLLVAWLPTTRLLAEGKPGEPALPDAAWGILEARCLECHGPEKQESGFRVDRQESLLKGGDQGEAGVMPCKPEASLLIRLVAGKVDGLRMPPDGEPLSAAQIDLLRKWITHGARLPAGVAATADAPAENHWSLRPLRAVAPPRIDDAWIANPIDAFILSSLRQAGLKPSPRVDDRTLVRRLHLVMHGLPPDHKRVESFVRARIEQNAAQNRAIDQRLWTELVDEVLQSPRYGERWAQHWLDVIRWAETWGYETNSARPRAWPYRDWLIGALNEDRPYDRMILEQLAGDTVGVDAATGFLIAGPANLPGQIGLDEESKRQARADELDEVVKTVSGAFLGLTVGCARCHSHKFDPITQKDYYSLRAVFAGLHYGDRRWRGPENDRWMAKLPKARRELLALRATANDVRAKFRLREPLSPSGQTERFAPVECSAIRMQIHGTNSTGRVSIYELQAWTATTNDSAERKNVALQSNGGKANASSFALANQTRHFDNLNDGRLSTDGRFPWIAKEPGPAWCEIAFETPAVIDEIWWQRGSGSFPVDYDLEVKTLDGEWKQVSNSRDRMLHEEDQRIAKDIRLDGVDETSIKSLTKTLAQIRELNAEQGRLSAGPQVFAGRFHKPDTTWRLHRGDVMQRRQVVEPNIPAVIGSLGLAKDAGDPDRRVALAKQIASGENPLTARVAVNRIWQHHFGTGLVKSPSDFGRMGEMPSHPELLDWLAVEFIQNGWSQKHLHRLILNSSTFRQAAAPVKEALAQDASARLLWRYPIRRLDAETIRDSILHASGKLNLKMQGTGFDFFNQKGGLTDYIPKETFDEDGWRRMIYATKIRMQSVDIFGTFDCPDSGQMTPRRNRSITPAQALALLNSPFVNRQAEFLATRLRNEAGPDLKQQIDLGFRLTVSRPARDQEFAVAVPVVKEHGLPELCRALFNMSEFIFLQ